jgi:hypothetical protein
MFRLDLLKKIGENVSYQYEINWEYWTEEEAVKIQKDVNMIIPEYEELFQDIDFSEDEFLEQHENVFDTLIYGYALKELLERRNKIEEIIKSL